MIWYEAPRLFRDRLWRELAVFLVIVVLGSTLTYLQSKGLPTRSWGKIVMTAGDSIWKVVRRMMLF